VTLWDAAITSVLEVEGGYVDHPTDPGGRTNWGISQRAYPQVDIVNLTRQDAVAIYERDYWTPIPEDLPDALRFMAFDAAVNHGLGRALGWLKEHPTLESFTARRLRFYADLGTFPTFGRGWTRRMAHVLEAIEAWEAERLAASPVNEDGVWGEARTVVLHGLRLAERWQALTRGPTVLRGRYVWRARGDKLDVRRAG
jgi:lysozyme family protein